MSRPSSNTNEYTYQWNPETYGDDDLPILKISKSSFGSFQWCPKKYQFNYIEQKPQDTSEAMWKGTIVHNAREAFFEEFDIAKAENMSHGELTNYCYTLFPLDEMSYMYETIATFEANRFMDSKAEGTIDNFIPVINEEVLDAKIVIRREDYPSIRLERNYVVHLQGIIDRMFLDGESYIPMELKTGAWKEYKKTMMRKEMAFYKLLFDNCADARLEELGLTRDNKITHWSWYYPASNHMYVEDAKKSSETAVLKGIAKLIHAYERNLFPTKYSARSCPSCSYYSICDTANDDGWL
jgi:CRISPR/Cas system-associated exonuclease Cas4 (RecB family)